MKDWIQQAVNEKPEHLFMMQKNQKITYRKLDDLVNNTLHVLRNKINDKDARIGFSICPCINSIALLLALIRLNVPSILLNTNLNVNEVKEYLKAADATHFLYSKERKRTYHYVSDNATVFTFDEILKGNRNNKHNAKRSGISNWNVASPLISVFTSGTSGKPKLVEFTLKNFYVNAISSALRIGSEPDDIWYLVLPLYHVGGLAIIFRTLILKTSIALDSKFDERRTMQAIVATNSTIISLVPTMLYRMLQQSKNVRALQRMRVILVGGAPTHPSLVAQCAQYSLNLFLTYGMTETTSQVATAVPNELSEHPKTVGLPLDGIEINIIDKQNKILGFNEIGEIIISGEQLASGYWKGKKIGRNFKTGDIGYCNAEGFVFIVDRKSNLIISGGENIYPAEIEAFLNQHRQITEACVVGIPDEEWGEKVVSMIEGEVTEKKIRDYCKDKLVGFKIPKHIVIVNQLPRLSSGKVARKEVQRQLEKKIY